MGKKYKVLAGRGQIIDLQSQLYHQLVDAIIDGGFNTFSKALTKFRPLWSADEDCHAASHIKDQFGENFNKLKIKLHDGKNFVELSPLQLAAKSGNTKIISFLLSNSSEPQALLDETIQVKMQEEEQEVELNNKEINGFNYVSGSTALHLALEQEHFSAAKLLLNNNTNPEIINQANAWGYPPLFLAAAANDLDTVDLLLAKGADRTTRVNNMNFAENAQRCGRQVWVIHQAADELLKRLASDFVPPTQPAGYERKPVVAGNAQGLAVAIKYILEANQNINSATRQGSSHAANGQLLNYQKNVDLSSQLVLLKTSVENLQLLIAQARLALAKRKSKNPSDPLIERSESCLYIIEDLTNAIIREFCTCSKEPWQSQNIQGMIFIYKAQMYENLVALSESRALERWLWRGFWAVSTIGLILSGAGITMLVASVSFEVALLAVVSFGALKSVEAAVIPAVVPIALVCGSVASRCTESWNNKASKRAVKAVTHNLEALNEIKAAPELTAK